MPSQMSSYFIWLTTRANQLRFEIPIKQTHVNETTENFLHHDTCKQATTHFDITYNFSQISDPKIPFKEKEVCADISIVPKQKKRSNPKVELMSTKKGQAFKVEG